MGRTKPTVSEEYVVGITDGEGCFYVNVSKSSAYRSGYLVQLHFHLKLQARDGDVLWKICNTLKCGSVYFQKENRENHTQCYRYTVNSQKDIFETLIPFFIAHPLQTTSKSASFETFCQIAKLVQQGRHRTIEGVEEIVALKKNMNKKTVGLA